MAGVYLVALFSIRRVPDGVLRAVGGPHGVARDGGLILRYRPPASYDAAKLDARVERHAVEIRHEAGILVLEVPGVAETEAREVATILTHGGLELREYWSQLRTPRTRAPGSSRCSRHSRERDDTVSRGVESMVAIVIDRDADQDSGDQDRGDQDRSGAAADGSRPPRAAADLRGGAPKAAAWRW